MVNGASQHVCLVMTAASKHPTIHSIEVKLSFKLVFLSGRHQINPLSRRRIKSIWGTGFANLLNLIYERKKTQEIQGEIDMSRGINAQIRY